MRNYKVYCPTNDVLCPYYNDGGECAIEDPWEECEDAMCYDECDYRTAEKRTAYE